MATPLFWRCDTLDCECVCVFARVWGSVRGRCACCLLGSTHCMCPGAGGHGRRRGSPIHRGNIPNVQSIRRAQGLVGTLLSSHDSALHFLIDCCICEQEMVSDIGDEEQYHK